MQTFTATEFTARNIGNTLTQAELETLAWIAEGKENAVIGMLRGHGEPGAKKLVSNVLHKFDCNSRCLAIARAFSRGYLIAKSNASKAIAAFLIVVSGMSAGTGDGQTFLRTASSRGQSTYRVRWEHVLLANHGSAA